MAVLLCLVFWKARFQQLALIRLCDCNITGFGACQVLEPVSDEEDQSQSMLAALLAAVQVSQQSSKVAEAMVQFKESQKQQDV